jgi:HEAT repeat protein
LLGNTGDSTDLSQLYSPAAAPEVKRAVIQGLFVAGNADRILEIVKNEKDDELRRLAINQLGAMGRDKTGAALTAMYSQETNPETKQAIINALFIQGNATAMVGLARKETDLEVKKSLVSRLGLMHSKEATDYLMEMLTK